LLACAIALSALVQPAHPSQFEVVGPGGGGAMFHPTVSPFDEKEVLVACDMTGAYITHDGGQSWRMFNLRGVVRFFAFDPVRRGVIYAGTTALWRSGDDGATWNLVWPKPATVDGVEMNSDHADETILSHSNPLGAIVALAIDPADSHMLTVAAVKDGAAALFISKNDGLNWDKETALHEPPKKIWIDPLSAANNRDLYVASQRNMMVRRDGHWRELPSPAGVTFTQVTAGFAAPHVVRFYAASNLGVFVSNDNGATWTPSPLPGKGANIETIATSRDHPDVAYASYEHLALDGKSWIGVAKTIDGGLTWTLVWKEEKTPAPNIHDAWIDEQLGPLWPGNPLDLGVADQDANLAYATDYGRTMQTTDGGANWHAVYSRRVPGAGWASTGLDVTTNYGYLFDPFDPRRRFIPTTDIGLFRSEDGGASWSRSVAGVPKEWSNTTYWVAFDLTIPGKMWGAMSGTHDLPRPKMWRKTDPAAYRGGVCVSQDGGRTWKPSNAGMPETAPTQILVDPASPADKRVLWAAAMGRGVYKSADDGVSWTLKNSGITQPAPLAWRLALAGDGTLYVVIARRGEGGSIGAAGDGAIYKSTDGAETWTPVKLPSETNGPNGLATDPHDPKRLYLAAWGRPTGEHGIGGGIFLSTDGGSSWKQVLDRDQHVYDVTIDPGDAKTLYAAGFESSAWRSVDRGEHWERIAGFNFKWGHRVTPDLDDPRMIYVSTFGGGIWHGPAAGAAGREDIATPALQPGH
jgi:photosystem II stability/assembly factor-like uncharacterized protein